VILRKALETEHRAIWAIIQQAIAARKRDGSNQWQNGYPNEKTITEDIKKGFGYVLENNDHVIAYAAIIFEEEPAYTAIKGKWLSDGKYCVVHRVATADSVRGKGMGQQLFKMIEDLCRKKEVYSIKVDTNFDNGPMLKILQNLDYSYCGEVFFEGPRRAYEKLLSA